MNKCSCETTGKWMRVKTPLVHASVYLHNRQPAKFKPNPTGVCVIQDLLMAVNSSSAELNVTPAETIPLEHTCYLCAMILQGTIRPDLAQNGEFDDDQINQWGAGWNKDN